MNPVVYLYEQQLKALSFPANDEIIRIEGYGFGWDNHTVFHAYHSYPQRPAGFPVSCVFFLSISPIDFKYQEDILKKEGGSLLVFLDKQKRKAFLKKDDVVLECAARLVPEKSDLYSRSKGLLETEALRKKSVGIVGLGSGGSVIALELAKAGVGKFVLIDFDRLELSNVARHICGINDLGRFKTLAVRDMILQKNPYAEMETLEIDVTENRQESSEALSEVDLIIAASDNDRSRFFLNELSLRHDITAIFGRALTRAIGGDVMRVRPHEGPCYNCLYSQNVRATGSDDEEISQKKQAEKLLPDYTSENDLQSFIQVGLASDIAPISNFMVKLALVELSKDIPSGISSLREDLIADFYIWANRRENVYQSWSKLEYHFNKPTVLRWYGAKVERDPNCMVCGS